MTFLSIEGNSNGACVRLCCQRYINKICVIFFICWRKCSMFDVENQILNNLVEKDISLIKHLILLCDIRHFFFVIHSIFIESRIILRTIRIDTNETRKKIAHISSLKENIRKHMCHFIMTKERANCYSSNIKQMLYCISSKNAIERW